jgi:hypothetical protein
MRALLSPMRDAARSTSPASTGRSRAVEVPSLWARLRQPALCLDRSFLRIICDPSDIVPPHRLAGLGRALLGRNCSLRVAR